jgi:hypothetical protein
MVAGALAVLVMMMLYPDITSTEGADIIFPHHLSNPELASHAGTAGMRFTGRLGI